MTKRDDKDWRRQVIAMLPTMEATAEQATAFTPAPANPQPVSFGAPHIAPPFDVIELLPEERKDLLRKLRQHADDARALAVPFEEVRAASMDRVEKENALRRLTDHPGNGGFGLKPDDRRVMLAQQALTTATEDLRRRQERSEMPASAQQAALRVLAASEDFLRHGVPGGCTLEAAEAEEPKLLKNEGLLDGVERFRRRGREIKASIHAIQSSCFPKSHCKQRARHGRRSCAHPGCLDAC